MFVSSYRHRTKTTSRNPRQLALEQLEDRFMPVIDLTSALIGGAAPTTGISPATFSVTFNITSDWQSGFGADMAIKNTGSSALSSWTLEFDFPYQITTIWNAEIASHTGNHYVIKNAAWNGTLAAGATVSFGFNGAPGNVNTQPTNYVLNGQGSGTPPPTPSLSISIANDAVPFTVTDDWGAGFVANMTINNRTSTDMNTWTLEFDFDRTITNIWGATIASHVGNHCVLKPMSWNSTIPAGAAVTIGFQGTTGNVTTGPTNIVLNGASVGTPPATTTPSLTIGDVTVIEGNSGSKTASFTVQLSAAASNTVTVDFATSNSTATAGSDYQAVSGRLSFAAGETQKTIAVTINGDTQVEADEAFFVTLTAAVGAVIPLTLPSPPGGEGGVRGATGTIQNDDSSSGGGGTPTTGKRVVAYYTEWSIYDRQYNVLDIPADKLTDLIYAFAQITPSGDVAIFDSWAAIEKPFPGDDPSLAVKGNFHQLQVLKQRNPNLHIYIAIGGWTLSSQFSNVALTPESRAHFASSAVNFAVTYGFDGIDIDWEYPVGGGLAGNANRPEDKHNFTLLLAELRRQLDVQETRDGKQYYLTAAMAAGAENLNNYELAAASQYVDWFDVMTYDYHGTWENRTNHQAGLYANPNDPSSAQYNVDWTIQAFLSAGVSANKIMMGVPLYTRAWQGVSAANNGLFQPATGAAQGTWEAGSFDYADLRNRLATHPEQYFRYWDSAAMVPYVYNPSLGMFSSYEDAQSMQAKLDYVAAHNLGGMFFWELSADVHDSNSADSLIGIAGRRLLGG